MKEKIITVQYCKPRPASLRRSAALSPESGSLPSAVANGGDGSSLQPTPGKLSSYIKSAKVNIELFRELPFAEDESVEAAAKADSMTDR